MGFDKDARPIARTIIRLDADSETILPMRADEAGRLEVDTGLFDLHECSVNMATEYRANLLNTLLSALQSFVK